MKELSDIYLQLGVTGFMLVSFVAIVLLNNRFHNKQISKQNEAQEAMNKQILNTLIDSTKEKHTIEKDLNITLVESKINDLLDKMLQSTGNSIRTFLVRFHNGGKDIQGNDFLKMSMTNERVSFGVEPIQNSIRDEFRSMYNWLIHNLKKNVVHVDDVEELKEKDYTFYSFLKAIQVKSVYYKPVRSESGAIVGFVGIEFYETPNLPIEKIEGCLKDKTLKIEAILSLGK